MGCGSSAVVACAQPEFFGPAQLRLIDVQAASASRKTITYTWEMTPSLADAEPYTETPFANGQAGFFKFDVKGKSEMRQFTMWHKPGRAANTCSITVRRVKNGRVSSYLAYEANCVMMSPRVAGPSSVASKSPTVQTQTRVPVPNVSGTLAAVSGDFTLAGIRRFVEEEESGRKAAQRTLPRHMLYVAGGIGIAPFHAHLTQLFDTEVGQNMPPYDIVMLYSERLDEEFCFTQDLEKWMALSKTGESVHNLRVIWHTTRVPKMDIIHGRITAQTISEHVPTINKRVVCLCGPRNMHDEITEGLQKIGVTSPICYESFLSGNRGGHQAN